MVAGSTTHTVGITNDGGIAILDVAAVLVDQAGMSAGSPYRAGTVLATTPNNHEQGYDRKLKRAGGR